MGYLSNANGTRLNITKGWYNKLVSNKFITDNNNIGLIKTFNNYSYQYFEEKDTKMLFKRANYLTNKPKLILTNKFFNLNVIYLEFYQKLISKYYSFYNLITKNSREEIEFDEDFSTDFIFKKFKIRLKKYFRKKSLMRLIFERRLAEDININRIKNKKLKLLLKKFKFSYPNSVKKVEQLRNKFFIDLETLNIVSGARFDLLFKYIKIFESYEFNVNSHKFAMLSRFINPALQKIFINNQKKKRNYYNNNFNYNITTINYLNVNSQFLTHFYLKKLKKKYLLHHMNYPLFKEFKRLKFIKGLKIRTRGRFTKTQRALYKNIKFGKVPLNTFNFPINYDFKSIPLKYGVSSIKIWLANRVKFRKQGHRFMKIAENNSKIFSPTIS